jgi:neutral ceramidase
MNGNSSLPGYGPFISAFGQTNEGDVSPNTKGPHCPDGSPCDGPTSTCPPLNRNEGCIAAGPGKDMYESAQIIGNNQFQKALELFNSASTVLRGPVAFVHTYVDFQNVTVGAEWTNSGNVEKTCSGSLGDSFAAGTTDGPGMFDFTQGTNTSDANTYWNFIASFLSDPTEEEKACQQPKPILLNTGDITFPNPWTASIMPLQIFRIGQLFIIGVPGEFTTMSGRRLRSTVLEALQDNGMGSDTIVVIAGLTNEYSHYITTWEEYQAQRYEGASTLFGPNTLAAYQQEYAKLAMALATGSAVPPGPTPADLSGSTYSFLPGVVVDEHPDGSPFGSVKTNVKTGYARGDSVVVEFWGANPRNNLMTQSTYLTVERNVNSQWQVVAVDGDWETKFQWTRAQTAESIITITWNIPSTAVPGTYRIQTYGSSKNVFDELTPYVGTSATFSVY